MSNMMKEEMVVVRHEQIAENIYRLIVHGEIARQIEQPGQFVHVKVTETTPLLRRPISICDINKDTSELTMIYRTEGNGTKILSAKKCDEKIDVLGPLGNGFPVEKTNLGETALLIGGGIGVPPLYLLAKQLYEKGVKVITVLGFQTTSVSFLLDEFAEFGKVYTATVDGSLGMKGFVTDVIQEQAIDYQIAYACGPKQMLHALTKQLDNKRLYISLEERMGCGVGACFACVCHVPENELAYKKVCSDGPVFQAGEVII